MKRSRRLDYSSLADALVQRGMVDPQRLSLALQTSAQSQIPFPEFLIIDGLVSDWDLSLVACDLYNLPFLPVDFYSPAADARVGLDEDFLRANRLVPLDRYGTLLTVCMPAIVSADTISKLATMTETRVLPVVGTVLSNNRWLEQNMPVDVAPAIPGKSGGQGWGNIFDEGDAAVLMELGGPADAEDAEPAGHDGFEELDADLDAELAILPSSDDDEALDPMFEGSADEMALLGADGVELDDAIRVEPKAPRPAAQDIVPLLSDEAAEE